jgi:hypothetical protein
MQLVSHSHESHFQTCLGIPGANAAVASLGPLSLSGWALALQNSIIVLPVVWMVEWFLVVYGPVFFAIAPTMVAT